MDVLNIEVSGKMGKMLCAPYKDSQDPLKFLEALDTDMFIPNANLADGADLVSLFVMAKLIDNCACDLEEVEPICDALHTVLKTPGIAANDY